MTLVIFTFILLLVIQLEAAHVEPPINVTLDCHNLVQITRWDYTEFVPGLQFRIHIGSLRQGKPIEFLVDSPDLKANFSLGTDPAGTYSLVVSAVVGENESDEVPPRGLQFSYDKFSSAPKKCFMDLPAVSITAMQDGFAVFSFMHPWLLYGDKIPFSESMRKKRHDEPTELIPEFIPKFKYDVVIVSNKGASQTFSCNDSVCEEKLVVGPQEEKLCLKISGEMEKMVVRGTQEYCAMLETVPPAKDDSTYIIYITVAILVLIALAFILFMVYKKLTSPDPNLPSSMREGWKIHLWQAVGVNREQVSVPEVEPASPTPLLPATEFPPATSFTEPEIRERIGVSMEDEGVSDNGDIGNDEGCGYTQGGKLDEDDNEFTTEPSSGYEKRPGV